MKKVFQTLSVFMLITAIIYSKECRATHILGIDVTYRCIGMPGNLTGFSIKVSPDSTTCFTVTGTTSDCENSNTVCVTVFATGMDDFNIDNINVAPNPYFGQGTITLHAGQAGQMDILCRDIEGRMLWSGSHMLTVGENIIKLDLNKYPGGIYLIELAANGKSNTAKWIK